jgi:uncharacterized protein YndB with AHSA1/START domain
VHEPVQANFIVTGSSQEEVFAALLEVERFPEWGSGLREARTLDAPADGLAPGTSIEFTLSAVGITHRVLSTVTVVEPPRLLEWRYTEGAAGTGGWVLKDLGSTVKMTFQTSYEINPPWLDQLAHLPFFRGVVEELLRRSMRRFIEHLKEG